MTSRRQRVMDALEFRKTDRIPRDMAGMRSTSISAFAYPALVQALGLPQRLPKVEDTGQMLALPDRDVLDALDIDVVTILDGVTNAFDQPEEWHPYDFNGRLPALVRWPENFRTLEDGTILQRGSARMVPAAYVFDEEHGGQRLDLSDELPRPDLDQVRANSAKALISDERIRQVGELCSKVRQSSDRAVFFNDGHIFAPISIGAWSGLAIFPMLCSLDPAFVHELHKIVMEPMIANVRRLLPVIKDDIDVLILGADDWGTQNNLIASPQTYRELFLPYYRMITDECHAIAPNVKLFLHSCGAIYNLIDLVIESGFDILNPVQWSAGKPTYRDWKDKARGRIALWGGGVNSQTTLPLGTVEDVARETREVTDYLAQDGGYVFCNIHNILAEIPPEKVIAMYRAVR